MKPEKTNCFSVNNATPQRDFLLSFFHEWEDTDHDKIIEIKRQKVASVILSLNTMLQFCDVMSQIASDINIKSPQSNV